MKLLSIKKILFTILFCCLSSTAAADQNLMQDIEKIVQGKKAVIGVAVIHGDDEFTLSNENRYPVMSVFKLHVAATALKKMENEHIPLDEMVWIEPEQMHRNTYSPLRDRFPNQRIHISYKEIMEYTLSVSDNNTCDWLIQFAGGIDKVNDYIKSLGIKDMNLSETENDMHMDIMNCYDNWSTPLAVAQLLKKIHTENILTDDHTAFLEETMLNCASGADKLKAGLPDGIKIGHKTGHSDRTSDGVKIGDADAGVICLPSGEKYYLVVLIKDSRESDPVNAKIMSDISSAVYKNLSN